VTCWAPTAFTGWRRRAEVAEFQGLSGAGRHSGANFDPLHPAGKRPIFAEAIFVAHRDGDSPSFFETLAPARFEIVIAASRPLKSSLQGLRRKGVHVGILQAKIARIAGCAELNADKMTGVFTGTARNHALIGDAAMRSDLAGHA